MTTRRVWIVAAVAVLASGVAGCSDGSSTAAGDPDVVTTTAVPAGRLAGAAPVDAADLGLDLSRQAVCDPLGASACQLPYPNDFFTVPDPATDTGRHLRFDRDQLPANVAGVHVDPAAWEGSDGFSPGSPILVDLDGLDVAASRVPGLDDIEGSLADDAAIVVVDSDTGERAPYWAELDALATDGTPRLMVHPAINYGEGHRIVVGIRGAVGRDGSALDPTPAFAAYRDGQRTTDDTFEARRPAMEQVFADLGAAGVVRDDLLLAWDFTVGSQRSISGRLVAMRDDALTQLGDNAPKFAITSVVEHPDGDARVFRQVDGTFESPLYMTGTGEPGASLVLDDHGLPVRQAGTFTAPFRCVIPPAAANDSPSGPAVPARMALYGHGLLGSLDEVGSDMVLDMASRYNVVYCGSNLAGMAAEDIGNAIAALGDLSKFSTMPDRMQQGIVAFHMLGRLLMSPTGLSSDPAFRVGGASVLKTDELYYDGNSQGAILGGALVATSIDITRAVLGEAGMNYALLLDRSVDFDEYLQAVFAPSYPDREDRMILLAMISVLWDRGETNGYAQHLTDDPLPGTPKHTVLLLGAVGDHQVTEYSLRVEARTAMIPVRQPMADDGRTVDGPWGLDTVVDPSGSRYVLFDTGSPSSPGANTPSRQGHDPHDDTPNIPEVQELKDRFLHPDGRSTETCATDTACVFEVPAANAD